MLSLQTGSNSKENPWIEVAGTFMQVSDALYTITTCFLKLGNT